MESLVTISLYILVTAVQIGCVVAPSVHRRHLVDDGDEARPASSILIAASDTGSSRGGSVYHDNGDDVETTMEQDCGIELQAEMNDCLEGFEVQLVVFENPQLTEVQRWEELRELCRRHDQTLQCIYTAFTRCQPTKADLQLMAYRIGHLRDFMLRECRIARARTTATITTTTTTSTTVTTTRTRARTATGTHRPPSHVLKDAADSNRDRNNVWRANGPVYVIDGASPSSPDADERFRVIDAVGVNELGNDTHSKLRESSSRKDHGFVLLCQMENDKSRTECLLEAYGGASSTGRQSSVTWRVLLSLVTICVIRF